MIFLRTFVTKLIYYSQESNFVDKVDFKGEFTIALKFISAKSFQNVIGTVRNNNATELPQKLHKNAGTTERDGRNDAKRLCTNVVTVSDEVKPKKRKMQGKAEYSRRTVCKSLPKKM